MLISYKKIEVIFTIIILQYIAHNIFHKKIFDTLFFMQSRTNHYVSRTTLFPHKKTSRGRFFRIFLVIGAHGQRPSPQQGTDMYPCDSGSGTASTTLGPIPLDVGTNLAVNSTVLSDDLGLKQFNAQE